MQRRSLIKGLSLLPFMGSLSSKYVFANKGFGAQKQNLFEELAITPIINATGTMTFLSGSLMLPEVMEAINSTSHDFADLHEVEDKIGAKMAEMLRCEAAMVTSGAACALSIGTAACITGKNTDLIHQIPSLPGPQREVIIQKSHRYSFDQAVRLTGIKYVEVEGPDEMERAINRNTVMAHFFNAAFDWFGVPDSISRGEFVSIAKRHNIPTFIDAAADYPPKSNLFRFQEMGFDLITFSGGKMLRGPQSAGLLFGRKDLIEAAKLNFDPYECPIGRPMKVNKEEMFGMYAALKTVLERDEEKEWQMWIDRTKRIASQVETIPTVKGETHIHTGQSNHFPGLIVKWNQKKVKITPDEVVKQLGEGHPKIVAGGGKDALHIAVVTLSADHVDIVARRLKEVLQKAS